VVTVTHGEYAIIAQIAAAMRRGSEEGLRTLLSAQTTDARMLVYGGVATPPDARAPAPGVGPLLTALWGVLATTSLTAQAMAPLLRRKSWSKL